MQALLEQQRTTEDYETWLKTSKELDTLQGLDNWKNTDESELYDSEGVRAALAELRAARQTSDMKRLLYIVRTSYSRNVGNMGNPLLYLKCHCGTKRLVEEYTAECEGAIEQLMESTSSDVDNYELMNTLMQTRKAFGRTALVLSGGSTLGLLHAGVLYELWRHSLLPKIISGSSAGAIFASIICIRRDDELERVWDLLDMPFNIFERQNEPETLAVHLKRFLKLGTWIDSRYLRDMLQELLGDITFQEAYNRTGRILNVTVSVAGSHEMPRLLNYLTAPNVLVWSAVCASCSVPLVFASKQLMAKNPRTKVLYPWSRAAFIDGSVDNDLPMARLAEMFNVNHFIACQVNPHVVPLLHFSERLQSHAGIAASVYSMGQSTLLDPGRAPAATLGNGLSFERKPSLFTRWYQAILSIIVGELSYVLVMANKAGFFPRATAALVRMFAQDYIGNITIVPELTWRDMGNLFKNPSSSQIREAMVRGRRATWPKLALLRNHCAIELALDQAIVTLKARLIAGGSPNKTSRTLRHHLRHHSDDLGPSMMPRSRGGSFSGSVIGASTSTGVAATGSGNGFGSFGPNRRQSTGDLSYGRRKYTGGRPQSPLSSPIMSRAASLVNMMDTYRDHTKQR